MWYQAQAGFISQDNDPSTSGCLMPSWHMAAVVNVCMLTHTSHMKSRGHIITAMLLQRLRGSSRLCNARETVRVTQAYFCQPIFS